MNTTTEFKATREDVEKLKRDWIRDGCWDIEDTEGFEDFRDELLAFRHECERRAEKEAEIRAQKERERRISQIESLGLNDVQAVAIQLLETTDRLTNEIHDLQHQIETVRVHTGSAKYIF